METNITTLNVNVLQDLVEPELVEFLSFPNDSEIGPMIRSFSQPALPARGDLNKDATVAR
jgi:hypothetical protein